MRQTANLIVTAGLVFATGCAEKPVLELQTARESFALARDAEADIYALEEYEAAAFALESAEFEVAQQDAAPFWSRSYVLALDLIDGAIVQAEQAETAAMEYKEAVFQQAQAALPRAEAAVRTADEALVEARGFLAFRELETLQAEVAAAFRSLGEAAQRIEAGMHQDALDQLSDIQTRADRVTLRARQVVEFGGVQP